jgi:hypothetical protein
MSTYLNIPILSGNLHNISPLQLRSNSFQTFEMPELKCLRIEPGAVSLMNLSSMMMEFCSANKRYKNYVIKVNQHYQSTGIGLLTYPFDSLPGIYANTAFVLNNSQTNNNSNNVS